MTRAHGWAALCLGAACGAALALPPDQIFVRAAALTWQVRALGANEQLLGAATGIAVAPGKLLTSCGALARAQQVQLRRGNTIYDARLESPDVERDLCQLDAPGLSAPAPVPGSARGLRPGQRLYVIGYGLGNAVTLGEGLVSAVHDAGSANERIQTTIPAARGLLGAGVYDEDARLVGVVTASPKEAAAMVFAVPADWVPEVAARGAAALAARSKPATAAAGSPGLPAAGSAWVYAHVDRLFSRRQAEFTVRVLRADAGTVEEALTTPAAKDSRRVLDTAEFRVLEHALGGSQSVIESAPYLLARNNGQLPADLGRVSGYPSGGAGLAPWVYKTQVHDWEQVTVPAGSFKALRLEIRGERERQMFAGATPAVGQFRINAWYAPEAKRYVRLEHKSWGLVATGQGRPYNDDLIELLKYSPAP